MFSLKQTERKSTLRYCVCALALMVIPCVFIIQCSINKPVAPTWNLKLSVPLVNKQYDMGTLIEKIDEDYLKVDSLGNPLFCFEEDLDTIRLTDKLRCDSASVEFKDTLGTISIHPAESQEILLNVSDFYPGGPGYVPPCSATIEEDFEQFSDFSEVTVQQAFASLSMSNNLGLDLNSVQISLIDRSSLGTLYTLTLPGGIDDGDSIDQDVIIENKTLSSQLGLQVKIFSLGGELQTLEGKYLLLSFTLDSMRVIQGEAKVPSFELSREETILFPTNSIIDSAEIKSGNLVLHLHNFTNLGADVYLDFPELEKDGEILFAVCSLPASSSSDLALVLDGYTLRPDEGNQTVVQTEVLTPGSGDDLIAFVSSDSVTADIIMSEMIFSQVCGIVEPTSVEIDQISRQLNIPQGFESAHLTSASLSLEIHNGVDLPANLSVEIQGDNGGNLSLEAEVEASGPFGTAVTSIYEDELGSLLSPVPERLTLTGQIICGDGETFGVAREEDFFFGTVKVSSPLELIWDSCRVEIEASSEEVDEDTRDIIQDQLNFGRVVLKVENHLPLGAEARMFFSRNEGALFSSPDLVIGPITVPAGELNYDGSVRESSFSQTEIEVSYDDLQVFTDSPFYMAGTIDLPGTESQTVTASAADFIKITSHLELNVKNKKD